jgi:hypothetical protein
MAGQPTLVLFKLDVGCLAPADDKYHIREPAPVGAIDFESETQFESFYFFYKIGLYSGF